jgi:hypothetical protein
MLGDAILARRAPALGVEHVVGRGVDHALDARLAGGGDDVEGADRVDTLERLLVRQPLLVDPHAVEDALRSRRRLADRGGVADVAAREPDLRR